MIWMNEDAEGIDAAIADATAKDGWNVEYVNGHRQDPCFVDYRFARPREQYVRPEAADRDPREVK